MPAATNAGGTPCGGNGYAGAKVAATAMVAAMPVARQWREHGGDHDGHGGMAATTTTAARWR